MESSVETTTLRDVARAAGVSTASASRALAGEKNVSPELCSRVVAAAARLGYVPNGQSKVAIVSDGSWKAAKAAGPGWERADFKETGWSAARVLGPYNQAGPWKNLTWDAGGDDVMLTTTSGSRQENLLAMHALLARGAQGMVFAEIGASGEIPQVLAARGIPWISLGEPVGGGGLSTQSVGRREGAVLAARYLAGVGHRYLGAIARPDGDTARALREILDPALVRVEGFDSGDGLELVEAMIGAYLERDDPPTAVICASDVQALALLRECAIRGIAVPQRLSVIGFGDAEFARKSYPALSTVRVATAELGVRIAQAVLASLNDDQPAAPDVAVKLVIRESTGHLQV